MDATERGAFCHNCRKEVIDFSTMSDREVIEFLEKNKAGCGRFRKDQVGTSLTIPVVDNGVFRWRRFLLALLPLLAIKNTNAAIPRPSYVMTETNNVATSDSSSANASNPDLIRISGKIADTTGEGIIGATVTLIDSSGKFTGQGAAADFDGNFSFSFDKTKHTSPYHLKIRATGLQSKLLTLSDSSLQTFAVVLESDTASREIIVVMGKSILLKQDPCKRRNLGFAALSEENQNKINPSACLSPLPVCDPCPSRYLPHRAY